VTTIYCDLDGVIANFVDGAIEAAALPLTHDDVARWNFFEPYMSQEHFWTCIHAHTYFWEDLPVYPWAHELVEALRSFGDVVFCSDPSHDDEAASGKIKWLKRHGFIGRCSQSFVLTAEKWRLSMQNTVLVDDSNINCQNFAMRMEAEGEAIVFPQRWNDMLGHATVDPVAVVVGRLKSIEGLGCAL
jgi:5'(3')-deoxyribonucleotidase